MKKAMSMLVGVALASSALAQQTVNSVNAVGFVKISVPAGKFVMASAPFADFQPTIQDMFKGQLSGNVNASIADMVMVWNPTPAPGAYVYYYKDEFGDWLNLDTLEVATNAVDTVLPGQGFWIWSKASSNQTVVLKGEVPNEVSATNAIGQGFTMIGYPYSSAQSITNTGFAASGAFGNVNAGIADQIIFFDSVTGSYIYNYLDENGVWTDEDLNPSSQKFELGKGAWYWRRGTGGFAWVESRSYPSVSQ